MEDIKIYLKELKDLCVQVDDVAYRTRMKIYALEEKLWEEENKKYFNKIEDFGEIRENARL